MNKKSSFATIGSTLVVVCLLGTMSFASGNTISQNIEEQTNALEQERYTQHFEMAQTQSEISDEQAEIAKIVALTETTPAPTIEPEEEIAPVASVTPKPSATVTPKPSATATATATTTPKPATTSAATASPKPSADPLPKPTTTPKPSVKPSPSPSPGGSYRTVKMTLTGYCNCRKCCGKWAGGATASGVMPKAGVTIASSLPFGTKIDIPGYGMRTVQDRGVSGNHLDIYFGSHSGALSVGRRTANCKVYNK